MKLQRLSDIGLSCEHPVRVYNKYVNDWFTVPCRKCLACQKNKSNKLVGRINSLGSCSSSMIFITLTYDDDHLPWFDFSCNELSRFDYRSKQRVYETIDPVVDVLKMSQLDDMLLINGMPDSKHQSAIGQAQYGVLQKKDLQDFFKRFRKSLLYALPTYTFKYFAVGEYGSYTFRPHYHAILFSDSTPDFQKLQSCCSLSWQQGFVDIQNVRYNVASYVGAYLSGSSPLPKFLSQSQFKPFHVHSNGSLFDLSEKKIEEFKKSSYFNKPYYSEDKNTNGVSVRTLSTTVRNYFFPKCRGFHTIDNQEKRYRYKLYAAAVQQQNTLDPTFRVSVKNSDGVYHLQDVKFSSIYDLRKKLDDPTKKSDSKLDNDLFTDIYLSYRVSKLSLDLHVDIDTLIDYLIDYYIGSDSPNHMLGHLCSVNQGVIFQTSSNFQLLLLRLQYEVFELCDNEDDVNFVYSLYNYESSAVALAQMSNIYKCSSVCKFHQYNLINSIARKTLVKSIKHKDRNSYYQLTKLT